MLNHALDESTALLNTNFTLFECIIYPRVLRVNQLYSALSCRGPIPRSLQETIPLSGTAVKYWASL